MNIFIKILDKILWRKRDYKTYKDDNKLLEKLSNAQIKELERIIKGCKEIGHEIKVEIKPDFNGRDSRINAIIQCVNCGSDMVMVAYEYPWWETIDWWVEVNYDDYKNHLAQEIPCIDMIIEDILE